MYLKMVNVMARLAKKYQPVSCIIVNGTQYATLPFYSGPNIGIRIIAKRDDISGYERNWFGNKNVGDIYRYRVSTYQNQSTFVLDYNGNYHIVGTGYNWTDNLVYEYNVVRGTFSINGTLIASWEWNYINESPLWICASQDYTVNAASGKIYGITIFDNKSGAILADYVPAIENNIGAFFDRISGSFLFSEAAPFMYEM